MSLGGQPLTLGSPLRRGLEPLANEAGNAVGGATILVKFFAAEFFTCGHAAFDIFESHGQSGNAARHKLMLNRWRINELQ